VCDVCVCVCVCVRERESSVCEMNNIGGQQESVVSGEIRREIYIYMLLYEKKKQHLL
jgi:hypothetical protein